MTRASGRVPPRRRGARRRGAPRLSRAALAGSTLLAILAVLAGCGGAAASSSPGQSAPVQASSGSAESTVVASSSDALATVQPAPPAIDRALLDLLPATVDGVARTTDPATDGAFRSDPTLASLATAIAPAVYPVPGGGAVLALPIRLRSGSLSDAAFRDFRATYGGAVCDAAGGLVGEADATVGTHALTITRCAAGTLVYYLPLPASRVLLVVDSPGGPRLAEDLIAQVAR